MRIQFDQATVSLLRESIRNIPRGVANLGTKYFELWTKNTVEASRPGSRAKSFPQQRIIVIHSQDHLTQLRARVSEAEKLLAAEHAGLKSDFNSQKG